MNTNNNIKTCCEKCYIYGSYADIRCYNLKCPCHSDTSEKECECNNHNIGEELCRCKKHHDFSQPIQSSWEEEFDKKFSSVESYSQRSGDYTEAPIPSIKSFIKNLLETEHKKWIENK